MSETAKGRAWRAHNVYTKNYVDRYDQIDWGRKNEPVIAAPGFEPKPLKTPMDEAWEVYREMEAHHKEEMCAALGIPARFLFPDQGLKQGGDDESGQGKEAANRGSQ